MGGILTGLIRGATAAKLGYDRGNQEHAELQSQADKAAQAQQAMAIKLALEEAARKRKQESDDRDYGLKAYEAMNKPKDRNIDPLSDEGIKRRKDLALFENKLPSRAGSGGADGGAYSTADARKSKAADDFAERQIEAFQGNAPKAVAYVESHPGLKREAVRLGVTQSHYNAATARRSARGRANPLAALLGGVTAPEPTGLSPEDQAKAASDPEFAAWLKANGHSK